MHNVLDIAQLLDLIAATQHGHIVNQLAVLAQPFIGAWCRYSLQGQSADETAQLCWCCKPGGEAVGVGSSLQCSASAA